MKEFSEELFSKVLVILIFIMQWRRRILFQGSFERKELGPEGVLSALGLCRSPEQSFLQSATESIKA